MVFVSLTIICIIMDWVSFTMKARDPYEAIELLGLPPDLFWVAGRGKHGYRKCLRALGISVCFDGQANMGVWVEMTGEGCRAFEELSQIGWDALLRRLCQPDINVTRLDIAGDDREGILNMDRMLRDVRSGNVVSRFRSRKVILAYKGDTPCGMTLYFGSAQSKAAIRIYDKAAERNLGAGTHWIRCELQLRDERAAEFLRKMCASSLGVIYTGALAAYLRFVAPSKTDSNKSRSPTRRYWTRFLNNAASISLFTAAGLEYTEERCRNYVVNQAGNAIDAMLKIHGEKGLLDLIEHRRTQPNPKYDKMVEQYRQTKGRSIP